MTSDFGLQPESRDATDGGPCGSPQRATPEEKYLTPPPCRNRCLRGIAIKAPLLACRRPFDGEGCELTNPIGVQSLGFRLARRQPPN